MKAGAWLHIAELKLSPSGNGGNMDQSDSRPASIIISDSRESTLCLYIWPSRHYRIFTAIVRSASRLTIVTSITSAISGLKLFIFLSSRPIRAPVWSRAHFRCWRKLLTEMMNKQLQFQQIYPSKQTRTIAVVLNSQVLA